MRIFIGSSTEALQLGVVDDLAFWLEEMGHVPIRWNDPRTFPAGATTLQRLSALNGRLDAAVLVFTGDDNVEYRNVVSGAPRDNVVFEYGLFCGILGSPQRVLIARYGTPRIPSDLGGIIYASLQQDRPESNRRQIKVWLETVSNEERPPSGVLSEVGLANDEQVALGLVLSDPMATTRGAWLYPLHQQLTYRGFTDVGATAVLQSLVQKGMLQYVEIPGKDDLTGKESAAPAYRATQQALAAATRYETIRTFREKYRYSLVLVGDEERNAPFLQQIRALPMVEKQSRFVISDSPGFSCIVIWSYEPINEGKLRAMAGDSGSEIKTIESL
jgi:hypothetical protein